MLSRGCAKSGYLLRYDEVKQPALACSTMRLKLSLFVLVPEIPSSITFGICPVRSAPYKLRVVAHLVFKALAAVLVVETLA